MVSRDYLKKQIDLLGVVLAKMMAKVTGAPDNFDISDLLIPDAPVPAGTTLPPLEEILHTPIPALVPLLREKYTFSNSHLWQYADILFTCAAKIERNDTNRAQLLYVRSLGIYEFLLTDSGTFDMSLNSRIGDIKRTLNHN